MLCADITTAIVTIAAIAYYVMVSPLNPSTFYLSHALLCPALLCFAGKADWAALG